MRHGITDPPTGSRLFKGDEHPCTDTPAHVVRYSSITGDALQQAGHGEDALAEDGLDTDAGQCAEVGERHQDGGASEQNQRRLPRVRKLGVRHVEPIYKCIFS